MILLAVVLVFGLVVGCGGKERENDQKEQEEFVFEGPFVYTPWGNTSPTIDANGVTIAADSSTGFSVSFESMGYTYNSKDILEITYSIDVTTQAAVLSAKRGWSDPGAPSGWGIGQGREYFLGYEGSTELSNYVGTNHEGKATIVDGTWDPATKTGTFQLRMDLFRGNDALQFQHNFWAEFPSGTKVAENSAYTLKFLKVENLLNITKLDLTADMFTVSNTMQGENNVSAVVVTSSVDVGAISIKYEGVDVEYALSAAIPQAIGTYKVIIDVAESDGYKAATGLEVGELRVVAGGQAIAVTIDLGGTDVEAAVEGVTSNITYLMDGSGFIWERLANWESPYAYFKLDIGADNLSAYEFVTFDLRGVKGDVGYKNPVLVASTTAEGVGGSSGAVTAGTVTNSPQVVGGISSTSAPVTLTINATRAAAFTGEIYFSLFINGNITTGDDGTAWEFSNIKFIKGELCSDCSKFPCECECEDCGFPPGACTCVLQKTDDIIFTADTFLAEHNSYEGEIDAASMALIENAKRFSEIKLTVENTAGGNRNGWGIGSFGGATISAPNPFADGATAVITIQVSDMSDNIVKVENAVTYVKAELWQKKPLVPNVAEKIELSFQESDIGTNLIGNNGTVTVITGGYSIDTTNGYGNGFAKFKVTFAEGISLADYRQINLVYNKIAGDGEYKTLRIHASATDNFGGYIAGNAASRLDTTGDAQNVTNGVNNAIILDINPAVAIGIEGNEVWFALVLHSNPAEYTITFIDFIPLVDE